MVQDMLAAQDILSVAQDMVTVVQDTLSVAENMLVERKLESAISPSSGGGMS